MDRARFADVPCWFDVVSGREIDCGELTVPENWSKPESKLIHLPVVIFRAMTTAAGPIVFLNGGPGDPSSIHTADEIRTWLGLLRSQSWTYGRDFIVMAQRGTNWTDFEPELCGAPAAVASRPYGAIQSDLAKASEERHGGMRASAGRRA